MSEEQADSTQENTEVSSEKTEASNENVSHGTQEQSQSKPAGYLPVDPETATPEQVQHRIDYLYRQVKTQGKDIHEYREIARLQSQKIDELTNGVVRVVDHLQTKQTTDSENEIRQKMETAWATGDNKTYQDEALKLTRLTVQREMAQQRPKNQTQQQAYGGVNSASQIANDAVKDGEISQEDGRVVGAWQTESDERGQPLRPWAQTENPNDPDPDFVKAMVIAKKVFEANPHRTIQENLSEVDKRMGVKKSTGGQNVMGGSLNSPGKRGTIRISPAQERIAVKTKFGSNKGAKSDSEYIAAYRKQIETVSTKGSR